MPFSLQTLTKKRALARTKREARSEKREARSEKRIRRESGKAKRAEALFVYVHCLRSLFTLTV